MSLLDEIRSDLVNEVVDISNTLRKAKILASAIGLPEFRDWVGCELSGYTDMDTVPSYRRFRPTNLGTFSGPFQSMVKNMVLPTHDLPDEVREFAENLIFCDGVGALEAQRSGTHQRVWPQEMVMFARSSIQMTGGMVLVDAYQPVPSYAISGVLDQVKNRLLDFVLGLQESNVTAEDINNRSVEHEVARNLFNINICGDRNIVTSGEQVNQQLETVQKGDIDSLIKALRKFNIDNEDLNELRSAISTDPSASESSYSPKVQAWLGGMISKAASSTWNVGLQTASKVLTDALNDYYDL